MGSCVSKIILAGIVFLIIAASPVFSGSLESRFQNRDKLNYDIYFNGISSGYIEWNYLGRQEVDGVAVDVLAVNSDTNILHFLDLDSKEKVFFDSNTFLPVMVERNIILFGKKDVIRETYDQDKGEVRISRDSSPDSPEIITQDIPIHNILELIYFFPKNLALENDKWMHFNLPTQKIRIKMVGERILKTNGSEKDTYFLVGRGAKRFSLWLDKKKKIPLRVEFITLIGKITVVKREE